MYRPPTGYRICRKCGKEKPIVSFPRNTRGCRERMCTACRHRQTVDRNPAAAKAKGLRRSETRRQQRIKDRAGAILVDSKKSDKVRGLTGFDLDREYVESALADGCRYCGDTSIMMTLDRVDNDLAHTRSNVVPACMRCNYLRRDMPYEAWLRIVPAVRAAREEGLFGDWGSQPFWRRRKTGCSVEVSRSDWDGENAGASPAIPTEVEVQVKLW